MVEKICEPNGKRTAFTASLFGADLPDDWRLVPVGEALTSSQYGLSEPVSSNGSTPIVGMRDISNGRVNLTDLPFVDEAGNDWSSMRLKAGDILLNRTNSPDLVGKVGIVREDSEAVFASYLVRLVVDRQMAEPEFVNYWLNTPVAQRALKRLSTRGVSQANINPTEFRRHCPLPLAPLPEQRKIAEILRTWDDAIEAATNLATALSARREALRTKLVTEAGIGGRPTVFGEFLKESRILGSDGASARKITVKLYGKGAVPKSDKRDGSTKTRYYRRSPGQLIYSKLDFLNGAFALVPESLQGYETSLDLPAFDISEHVNPKWLIEYLTRSAYYTAQLHLARGQRKARRIAPDDFLASPVKLPQRDRQDEIAGVLAVADREIALRETELDTLVRQKRGLMQKLLTGEWRVNTTDFCHAEPRGRK